MLWFLWPLTLLSLSVRLCSSGGIDPSQFFPSQPVSVASGTRHLCLTTTVPLTLALFCPCSLRHADQPCTRSSMRTMRRNSSAESSNSLLGMYVPPRPSLPHPCSIHHCIAPSLQLGHVYTFCCAGHGSEPNGADEHPEQNHFQT